MAKYTTELRTICEVESGYSVEALNKLNDVELYNLIYNDSAQTIDDVVWTTSRIMEKINFIVSKAAFQIIGDYPLFDENYRNALNSKILKHFFTREICEETVALWKLRLNNLLNEIMPYYNKLYESNLIKFDPLIDSDYQVSNNKNVNSIYSSNDSTTSKENIIDLENYNRTENNSQNETQSSNTTDTSASSETRNKVEDKTSLDKYSDTPQSKVTVISDGYLTNIRDIHNTDTVDETNNSSRSDYGTENSNRDNTENKNESFTKNNTNDKTQNIDKQTNGNNTTTEGYIEQVTGKRNGLTYSKMLIEFRETFLNIDKMILNELECLFMGIW